MSSQRHDLAVVGAGPVMGIDTDTWLQRAEEMLTRCGPDAALDEYRQQDTERQEAEGKTEESRATLERARRQQLTRTEGTACCTALRAALHQQFAIEDRGEIERGQHFGEGVRNIVAAA